MEKGLEKFAKLVKTIDLEAVNKISTNDIVRLRRIWEVNKFTDSNLSYWLQNKNKKYSLKKINYGMKEKFNFLKKKNQAS